jgi:hypothetical protein
MKIRMIKMSQVKKWKNIVAKKIKNKHLFFLESLLAK